MNKLVHLMKELSEIARYKVNLKINSVFWHHWSQNIGSSKIW